MKEVITLGFLGINAWLDWRKKQISLAAAGIYGSFGIVWAFWHGREWQGILLSMSAGLFFVIVSLLTRQAVGMGDGLLLTALGTVIELQDMLAMLCIGLLLSAGWAMVLFMVCKKGRKAEMPFVPFLLIGYVGGCCLWGT